MAAEFQTRDCTRVDARRGRGAHRYLERIEMRPSESTNEIVDRVLGRKRATRLALAPADNSSSGPEWSVPKDIPTKLANVADFSLEFLPPSIGPWVGDISERLQCPPDYVAITALTGLGALIGRRIGIKPQQRTDWLDVPNIWGCFVGKPGLLKSPAMMEALIPLRRDWSDLAALRPRSSGAH